MANFKGTSNNDLLVGTSGDDLLEGLGGNDTLQGLAGNDSLVGGEAIDTARYDFSGATGAAVFDGTAVGTVVVVELPDGEGGTDRLDGIERLELIGSVHNDTLFGGAGDDVLRGNAGTDLLVGGGGLDAARYDFSTATSGTSFDGSLVGTAPVVAIADGQGATDWLDAIEQLDLIGSNYSDSLVGGAGNDTLRGNAGDDTLVGGAGNDTAFYDFRNGAAAVTLDGSAVGTAQAVDIGDGQGGTDRLVGIEHLVVWGSWSSADKLAGGTGDDTLWGGSQGNDTLDGGAGNDSLAGSRGDNLLQGGPGDDWLRGDAGNDTLLGGDGFDTAYEEFSGAVTGVLYDASPVDPAVVAEIGDGRGGTDRIGGIERMWIKGSRFADKLTGGATGDYIWGGGAGNDVLAGGGGDDSIEGGDSDDALIGGGGDDWLSGEGGTDTAVFSGNYADYTIDYDAVAERFTLVDRLAGRDGTDRVEGVEYLQFADGTRSAESIALEPRRLVGDDRNNSLTGAGGDDTLLGMAGDDTLTGSGGSDSLDGGEGNDELSGGTGNDSLLGAGGNDWLEGGAGNDTLTGGDGFDVAYYDFWDVAGGARFDGAAVGPQGAVIVDDLHGGQDLLEEIERLWLDGSPLGDSLFGGTGSDAIGGGGGDDWLVGGAGDDLIAGEAGNDTVIGGDGVDTGYYDFYAAGTGVVLNGAAVGTAPVVDIDDAQGAEDQLREIEQLWVQGSKFADSLTGGSGNDTLYGAEGNDTVTGGAGDDSVDGGAGTDTVTFSGNCADYTVDYDVATGRLTASDGVAARDGKDLVEGVESLQFADTLRAVEWFAPRQLRGGDGSDNLSGGGGSDTLQGMAGDDLLLGESGADFLDGGDGDDWLQGGSGNDLLDGGAGNDTQKSDAGNDTLLGGNESDDLRGGEGNDSLDGGAGDDEIRGDAGGDTLVGSAGNDTLRGDAGADTAVFSGSYAEYTVRYDAYNDLFTIVDSVAGRDGTDTVRDVESLQFADGSRTAEQIARAQVTADPNVVPYFIRGLDRGPNWHWGAVGTGQTLTYAFSETAYPGWPGFQPYAPVQQATVRLALEEYARVANLQFNEVPAASSSALRFFLAETDPVDGFAQAPPGGSVVIDNDLPLDSLSGYSGHVLLHEIGHALGMRHPFGDPEIWLEGETVMSYTALAGLGPYDLATLHYLYGTSPGERIGDDEYAFTDRYLWDGAGVDTLSAATQTAPVYVDLGPGRWSWIGAKSPDLMDPGQAFIGVDTWIENAVGGLGADAILGNALANRIEGGAGNDTLVGLDGSDSFDGGPGLDVACYPGSRSGYVIGQDAATVTVSCPHGTDGLDAVERLRFDDLCVAFDIEGNAGQGYRLYQAAFDRPPDLDGLSFWIGRLDDGVGLLQVAEAFLGSAEFASLYGVNPSDGEFVTLLYQNVLHRAPDQQGYAFWLDALASGATSRAGALAAFSESGENKAALLPVLAKGIEYREAAATHGTDGGDSLIGTARTDWLRGGDGRDLLAGLGDDDTIDGGADLDTASYGAGRSRYTVVPGESSLLVVDTSLAEGIDMLVDVERLQFADFNLAFDIDGNAGQTYRLYRAAFDRVPDLGGLGFWIEAMDDGTRLADVAAAFVSSSEFSDLYGANPSDAEFITLVYENVLDRPPDQDGYDFWLDALGSGAITRTGLLVQFSESVENQAALIGVLQQGIEYLPVL